MKAFTKLSLCAAIIFAIALLTACGGSNEGEGSPNVATPQKIVVTAPSNVEILVGLGLADKLIAVELHSADIEGIDSKKTAFMDFNTINAEEILALEPDLVVASSINSTGTGDDPYALIRNAGIEVIYLTTPQSIDEIYEQIELLGEKTSTQKAAADMVKEMKESLADVENKLRSVTEKKSVYFEISPAPDIYTFGGDTFFNEILSRAGGENIFATESDWFSPSEEVVILASPDVIITNVTYIENAVDEIKNRSGWWTVTAIINDEVHLVTPNYTSRASQHVVKGVEEIAAVLYPEIFK